MKKIILFLLLFIQSVLASSDIQSMTYHYETIHTQEEANLCYRRGEILDNKLEAMNIDGLFAHTSVNRNSTMAGGNLHFYTTCVTVIYLNSYSYILVNKEFKKKLKGKYSQVRNECIRIRNEFAQSIDNIIEVKYKLSGGGLFGLSKKYKCKIDALYVE
ncbi:hypothetical protein [Halobacteriovorax sp. DPLXC-1]|uniref:hypothetical protein n=1 Tax=unclassified Halobacteriovorax TaxID=2639665 RepID=UPI002FEF750B